MYGRQKSFFGNAVLSVLSFFYTVAISVRFLGYRLGWLTSKELPCPVISIGNITLGGTGKTPAVISIAKFFYGQGRQPVVVSRGYGRENESDVVVVSDGVTVCAKPALCGDEPILIASNLSGVPVIIGKKRYYAATSALNRFRSKIVILDDGFQHVQLRRKLDIVLIDATDPFGNGKLFPAGILREPLSTLKRAHAVLITRTDQGTDVPALKKVIERNTSARIFTSRMVPCDLLNIATGETRSLAILQGAKVLAFSGIARPASFAALLKALGASIEDDQVFPDHYNFTQEDLDRLYHVAKEKKVDHILTTEKDAVKIKHFGSSNILALRITLFVDQQQEWESFLLQSI
ncbi:MAG: tetraacyldisaccharide 4'-kinase [Nitrospirota bacterium]